jgi:enamine deaminase RidA (YjgF/YER057c/UK114 family)
MGLFSIFLRAPYPARTTCVVQALPIEIEIECVAALQGR